MPMFSPSCGSTRMTTGPARARPALVLSVPDISLHFLIQRLKILNQLPKRLIQHLMQGPGTGSRPALPTGNFAKEITGLAAFANPQSESQLRKAGTAPCARFTLG